MSDVWAKGLVTSSDFLSRFITAYNTYTRNPSGFEQREHPEDIEANATTALEWYAHGWSAALQHIRDNAMAEAIEEAGVSSWIGGSHE